MAASYVIWIRTYRFKVDECINIRQTLYTSRLRHTVSGQKWVAMPKILEYCLSEQCLSEYCLSEQCRPPMLAYNTFHVLTPSLGWQVRTSDLHIVEILWRSFSKVNTTNTTNCCKQLIKSFAACTTLSLVVIIYLLHPVQVKNVIAVIMAQNQSISILNTLFCPELQLSSVSTLVTSRISCSWWHCSLTTRN